MGNDHSISAEDKFRSFLEAMEFQNVDEILAMPIDSIISLGNITKNRIKRFSNQVNLDELLVHKLEDILWWRPLGTKANSYQKEVETQIYDLIKMIKSSRTSSETSWLPIDTCPKETTQMFIVIGKNVEISTTGYPYTTDAYCVWHSQGKFVRWPFEFDPTHWCPLPV